MKKTNLWKRFVLIDALVVLSVVSVFAWFYMGDIASVKTLDEQVIDASYIRISGDGGETWENGLDIDLGTAGVVREMSGNGLELYEPIYGMDAIDGYSLVTNDEYYIEKTLTFESDVSREVYLTGNSFLRPANPTENLSNLGDFSHDFIAGAVRVAFFEVKDDGSLEQIYVWVPNPKIEYTGDSVLEDGSVEVVYSYQNGVGSDDVVSFDTNGNSNGIAGDGTFIWGSPEQEGVRPLLSFETENKQPVRMSLMIRVWLEGTDRECVKALNGGQFRMYFDFNTPGEE